MHFSKVHEIRGGGLIGMGPDKFNLKWATAQPATMHGRPGRVLLIAPDSHTWGVVVGAKLPLGKLQRHGKVKKLDVSDFTEKLITSPVVQKLGNTESGPTPINSLRLALTKMNSSRYKLGMIVALMSDGGRIQTYGQVCKLSGGVGTIAIAATEDQIKGGNLMLHPKLAP